jgi:seryl-tRNA synthetase
MLDIRLVRKDKEAVEAQLKTKDPEINLTPIVVLDERIRVIKVSVEELKATRNAYLRRLVRGKETSKIPRSLCKRYQVLGIR